MKYLNDPVVYLQDSDFDASGNLINPNIPKDQPVVIMIQANFCGYCTQAKPAFQQYADQNKGKVFCATIQGDGTEKGEKELGSNIDKIKKGFRGYPDYIKYKGGKSVPGDISGRSLKDLEAFGK